MKTYLLGKLPPEAQWAQTNNEEWEDMILSIEKRRALRGQVYEEANRAVASTSGGEIVPYRPPLAAPVVKTTSATRFKQLVCFLFESNIYNEEDWHAKDPESLLTYQSSQTLRWQMNSALQAATRRCLTERRLFDFWLAAGTADVEWEQNRVVKLLRYQGYDPKKVGALFIAWGARQTGKKNALWLFGPATTGKTNLASAVVRLAPLWGCVNQTNESFPFNDAANKCVIWWEEACMRRKMVETAKMILGGQPCRVDQKNKGSAFVRGTPVIVTSNVDITLVTDGNVEDVTHRQPLMDRLVRLDFKYKLPGDFGLISREEVAGWIRGSMEVFENGGWGLDDLEPEPMEMSVDSDLTDIGDLPDVTDGSIVLESCPGTPPGREGASEGSSIACGQGDCGIAERADTDSPFGTPAEEASPRATSTPCSGGGVSRKRKVLGGELVGRSSVKRQRLVSDSILAYISGNSFNISVELKQADCSDPFAHLFGNCDCNGAQDF